MPYIFFLDCDSQRQQQIDGMWIKKKNKPGNHLRSQTWTRLSISSGNKIAQIHSGHLSSSVHCSIDFILANSTG